MPKESADWQHILDTLTEFAQSRRFSDWGLTSQDLEDIKQATVLTLIELAAQRQEIGELLLDPVERRAYVWGCFRNRARECVRERRKKPLLAPTEQAAGTNDSDPARAIDLALQNGWTRDAAEKYPFAGLAINVLSGRTTLLQYARESQISLRTAQRHYALGVEQLKSVAPGPP